MPGQEERPQGGHSCWARPQPWRDTIIPSQLTGVARVEEVRGLFQRNWATGIYGSQRAALGIAGSLSHRGGTWPGGWGGCVCSDRSLNILSWDLGSFQAENADATPNFNLERQPGTSTPLLSFSLPPPHSTSGGVTEGRTLPEDTLCLLCRRKH